MAADLVLPPDNPFAAPSPLPFALPPFDRIRPEHLEPAFAAGMAEQRAEVARIAADPEPPTFASTIEALERSGQLLDRVSAYFFNLSSALTTPELDRIEAAVAPALAAHRDALFLDPGLYARVAAVHAALQATGDRSELDAEQRRVLDRYHTDFVRAGARLTPDRQARLAEINAELSALTTRFRADLTAETTALGLHLTDPADLAGLPEDAVSAAQEAARARDLPGYLLPLVLPTGQPALAGLRRRDVRERLFRASASRGLRGTDHDTRAGLVAIVRLRAERARLLGYRDHAAYVIADSTAGTVEAVAALLTSVIPTAVANTGTEAAELEALLVADGEPGPLQPWDWAYYAQARQRDQLAVDADALRPYFALDRVVEDGVFAAARELYGLRFVPRPDLPTYHPDVATHEVLADDGTALGLLVTDWYARDSKRGGAWMSTFVDQSRLLDQRSVVVINLNLPRPRDGEPTLLTLDEVTTAFHEFGHALHALLSDVRHPRVSGTRVPRDFVEFPSQVNEMWALWPPLVARYAVHHRTGEALPAETVERLVAAQSDGQGFATTEFLAATVLDLAWHRLREDEVPDAEDVEKFEREALAAQGLDLAAVPPRYRSSYFAHVFAGGYSAGYYSYLWSEVLDADAVDWFAERGGLNRDSGRIFAREVLSRGGAVDPLAAFAAVRGRPPRVEPLLVRRGLAGDRVPAAG